MCAVRLCRCRSAERDGNRLAALRRVDHLHENGLTFGELGDAGRAKDRDVDEDVLAAVIAGDEAEALRLIEPFDLAADVRCRGWVGSATGGAGTIEGAARLLDSGSGVDFDDARDLSA